MAYQTRGREPLLDSRMTEALGKRGQELLGLLLVGLALVAGATLYSYSPEDPSWMTATDGPVQNWLGAPGASVAAPLFMIIGLGAWGLAILPCVWGLRLMAHAGAERAPGRLIFAPIWVALLSLYAATLGPPATWAAQHGFGLGGLFGDTVLGTLLGLLPVAPGPGLRLSALALGVLVLVTGAFVLGLDRAEMRRAGRFLLVGLILTYEAARALLVRGVGGLIRAGQTLKARRDARSATAAQAAPGAGTARCGAPSRAPAAPAPPRTATAENPARCWRGCHR